MPSDDIKSYVTSDTDFYELLGVTFETSQKDIDRAWRKTALRYHPDKVGNDEAAKNKFHLAQIGYDLLSDPASKAIYDNARNARLQRKRANELLEGRRRQMKDDLEAREKGVKRARDEDEGEEERLEREIRRLAEDGKRRRKEREEALRREMAREEEDTGAGQQPEAHPSRADEDSIMAAAPGGVSELDRTVKVRWSVENDEGDSMTAEGVKTLFSTFGRVESADLLNRKMMRLSTSKKKQLGAVCMVQFASVVGAHAAVEDFRRRQHDQDQSREKDKEWRVFDTVYWASNKEPEFINASQPQESVKPTPTSVHTANSNGDSNNKSHGHVHGNSSTNPFAHLRSTNGNTNGKNSTSSGSSSSKPTFTSFSSPSGTGAGNAAQKAKGPTLEEITMIRLKEAEKRRLAAEIQRRDEEADAAAAATIKASAASAGDTNGNVGGGGGRAGM